MTDWHNPQVIEATTEDSGRQVLVNRPGRTHLVWQGAASHGGTQWFGPADLSDVRVIVDAEGKVMPPPITDEMRKAINAALWETLGMANVQPLVIRQAERRVLSALGGADHG